MYIKVYCIIAHKNPKQIKELIGLLQDNKSLFFIHLDKTVDVNSFRNILEEKNCFFIKKRVSCTWGTYSLVQATLNAMAEVQEFIQINYIGADYHFVLLSGEDLPLKSTIYIHEFLKKNAKKSFLHYWSLPYGKWWAGGFFRLENIYLYDYKKYSKRNYWLNRVIKTLQLDAVLPLSRFKNQFPDFKIYGSSQWMILNQDLVTFVLNESTKNVKFNSIFKYVLAPDELYFATLILNFDKQKQFEICNIPTHLIHFEGADASPKYLQIKDLVSIRDKDLLFARKFDPLLNQQAIDFIKSTIKA